MAQNYEDPGHIFDIDFDHGYGEWGGGHDGKIYSLQIFLRTNPKMYKDPINDTPYPRIVRTYSAQVCGGHNINDPITDTPFGTNRTIY